MKNGMNSVEEDAAQRRAACASALPDRAKRAAQQVAGADKNALAAGAEPPRPRQHLCGSARRWGGQYEKILVLRFIAFSAIWLCYCKLRYA